jgi:hypothetical protein
MQNAMIRTANHTKRIPVPPGAREVGMPLREGDVQSKGAGFR